MNRLYLAAQFEIEHSDDQQLGLLDCSVNVNADALFFFPNKTKGNGLNCRNWTLYAGDEPQAFADSLNLFEKTLHILHGSVCVHIARIGNCRSSSSSSMRFIEVNEKHNAQWLQSNEEKCRENLHELLYSYGSYAKLGGWFILLLTSIQVLGKKDFVLNNGACETFWREEFSVGAGNEGGGRGSRT